MDELHLGAQTFEAITAWMYERYGVVLTEQKRYMVQTRLQSRLRALGLESFEEYVSMAFGPTAAASEQAEFVHALTTHKTDFFREPHHYRALSSWLHDGGVPVHERPVRIWCAGCSTGEEVYSIAITLEQAGLTSYQLIGTDVSERVLDTARCGHYDKRMLETVSPDIRLRYFRPVEGSSSTYAVADGPKQKARFARVNLMAPSYRLRQQAHAIFCRNVLIYFDRPTQRQVLMRLVDVLAPGGLLFLGHSESLQGFDLPLSPVGPTTYRHDANSVREAVRCARRRR